MNLNRNSIRIIDRKFLLEVKFNRNQSSYQYNMQNDIFPYKFIGAEVETRIKFHAVFLQIIYNKFFNTNLQLAQKNEERLSCNIKIIFQII